MTEGDLDELLAKLPQNSEPSGPCIDDGVLLAYRDRTLGPEAVDSIEKHLASCATCRRLLTELSAPMPLELEDWARGTLQRRRRWWQLPSVVAIAAGALLAVLAIPAEDPLPAYRLQGPLGGVRETRGEGESLKVFVPTSQLEILLRPEHGTREPVSLLVFVRGAGGELIAAPHAGLEQGDAGTFRYQIEAERLFGSEFGARTLHLALTRGHVQGTLQGSEAQVRRELPEHHWFTVEVEYRASIRGER